MTYCAIVLLSIALLVVALISYWLSLPDSEAQTLKIARLALAESRDLENEYPEISKVLRSWDIQVGPTSFTDIDGKRIRICAAAAGENFDQDTVRLVLLHEALHGATKIVEHNDSFFELEEGIKDAAERAGLVTAGAQVDDFYPAVLLAPSSAA